MSGPTAETTVQGRPSRRPWALWRRQVLAIVRLELEQHFLGRRAYFLYFFALTPILLLVALTFKERVALSFHLDFGRANIIFAQIYEGLILRTVLFFGCAWIFMNLFRGEIVNRSLHYFFLLPVRREVLLAGKYLSGLIAASTLFVGSTLGSLVCLYLARGYPENVRYLFDEGGLGQVLSYLGIAFLGCAGYGAVFLVIGLFFRNPMIPALAAYGWESINFLLPPVLKKISVVHYLHSLVPVPVSEGPFALVAEPTPAWLSIPGFLILATVVLILGGWRTRRMEISYAG
ncbi:MAG: ABC transporter permease, partial [Acidobacteria bacterium]|nr:ABC transporter permease [Acidobacteriota bacterium]